MEKKIRITITTVLEFVPDPEYYHNTASIEEMLLVETNNANQSPYNYASTLVLDNCGITTVKGEII